ncbi:MAG: S8/S53 family peptidase [Stagnimonas sp.]|nr:S8/S53 family peptidase [Stagnimonas sp.]
MSVVTNRTSATSALFAGLLWSALSACSNPQEPVAAITPTTPVTPPVITPPVVVPPVVVPPPTPTAKAFDDVVVIAVIDSNINPYHWDYLAAKMPQAGTDAALPLDQDPATWLPGHPGAAAFKSYQALNLTLDATDPTRSTAELHTADAAEWAKINYSEGSSNDAVNYYWMPGTKVIGHVAFSPGFLVDPVLGQLLGPSTGPIDTFAVDSHGIGTSSVAAGNIHGSCPNCLIVYVHGTAEQANAWVSQQDWIDLQTNSWGASVIGGPVRDLVYAASDTELQRTTVERGQAIVFSAGNGLANDFGAPHTTLLSSQKGPDWIISVGAISPEDDSSYFGHGKPADISSYGDGYPSATGGDGSVTASGPFGGTSNAAPVMAGMYGEALHRLRKQLPGASRMQADGVIAAGLLPCGAANSDCALADGQLTVHELTAALFRSAQYTVTGTNIGSSLLGLYVEIPMSANQKELEFLAEGHGSLFGKLKGDENYEAELARITGFATGEWFAEQDADQKAWMIADSICRQAAWGSWEHGYTAGNEAPALSPTWPVRTYLAEACPLTLPPVIAAEKLYYGGLPF